MPAPWQAEQSTIPEPWQAMQCAVFLSEVSNEAACTMQETLIRRCLRILSTILKVLLEGENKYAYV